MADFVDSLELLSDYLNSELSPTPVVTKVPSSRPTEFVNVRRAGGVSLPPVRERVRFDVWAWSTSEPEAMDLAMACRRSIWALAGNDSLGVTVYRVEEFLSPTQYEEPETGIPRVWATYELDIRADGIIHRAP